MSHIKQWTWDNNVLSRIDWSLFGMKWKWMHNHLKWNRFDNEFISSLSDQNGLSCFSTVLMEGTVHAGGIGRFKVVILVCLFPQITTGTLHHSPPPRLTCTSPPFRVRPAPTSPSISRPAHPTASSWKTWATLTSFAWNSNVRCIQVILRESFLSVCLSHSYYHSLSRLLRGLIQQSVQCEL